MLLVWFCLVFSGCDFVFFSYSSLYLSCSFFFLPYTVSGISFRCVHSGREHEQISLLQKVLSNLFNIFTVSDDFIFTGVETMDHVRNNTTKAVK